MRTVLLSLILVAGTAAAQPTSAQSTAAEIAQYRATMDDMHRYAKATFNLNQLVRAHPALAGKTRIALQEMDRIVPNLKSDARLLQAVQSAGITPERYALISVLTVIAGFSTLTETEKEGRDLFTQTGLHPDNYAFFKQHGKEISALNKVAN